MENLGLINSISTAFTHGGIWMWAILITQIVSIAIIVERVWALYLSRKSNQSQLIRLFEKDIKSGDLDKVVSKAKSLSKTQPIGSVVQAGAQAALDMGGREEVQAQMDEVLLHENARLETRTGLLAMLSNTGTLLGLLGTIIGLIKAFSAVAGVNPVEKASLLTQGISMAMNTTAYGLIMAIPALVMYGVLQSRSQKLADDLNKASLKAFNWLSFKYEYIPKRTVRKRSSNK